MEERYLLALIKLNAHLLDPFIITAPETQECYYIHIASQTSMFVGCFVCKFLQSLLAQTSREHVELLKAIRLRLGKHYGFQAAQRLADERLIEAARRSNHVEWYLVLSLIMSVSMASMWPQSICSHFDHFVLRHLQIDKMDQSKTNCPCVHSLHLASIMNLDLNLMSLLPIVLLHALSCPVAVQANNTAHENWERHGDIPCGLDLPDDRLCIWTLYEDSKHGGNCQSSLLFAAFHRQVCNSQCVPESWVISADNTVKETKNGMTFTFFLWMLCALSNTRFWRVRTVYKLVGHTHSHVDRAFSRIRAALQGKSYVTEKDMQNHIVTTLRSYSVGWDHLVAQLDFDALRTLIGIDVHNLRNVHDLELFRTEGGVFCRFKQYMSDEMWSRPRLVLTRDQVPVVARAPLTPIEHKFSDSAKTKFQDFITKFELLASTNLLGESEKTGQEFKCY